MAIGDDVHKLMEDLNTSIGNDGKVVYPKKWNSIETHFDKLLKQENIELTSYARMMLLIPLAEEVSSVSNFDADQTKNSLEVLVKEISHESSGIDVENYLGKRNSRSIIRAFWNKYCNMPPFCGRR